MSDGPVFGGKEQVNPPPYLLVKCAGDTTLLQHLGTFTGPLYLWRGKV